MRIHTEPEPQELAVVLTLAFSPPAAAVSRDSRLSSYLCGLSGQSARKQRPLVEKARMLRVRGLYLLWALPQTPSPRTQVY